MPKQRLHLSLPRAERPPLFRPELKVSLAFSLVLGAVGVAGLLRAPAPTPMPLVERAPAPQPQAGPLDATPFTVAMIGLRGLASPEAGSTEVEGVAFAHVAPRHTETPALASPSWPAQRPRIAAEAPLPPSGPTARAVAQSVRPTLRPAAAEPVIVADAEPAEAEVVTASLVRSPLPRPRPGQLLATRRAVEEAIAADAVASRRLPAPEALATPAPEVQTVAFDTSAAPVVRGAGSGSCSSRLSRDIPRRAPSAASASRVVQQLGGAGGSDRDRVFTQELLAGNMPGFLRRLTPVSITGTRGDGRQVTVTICVTPDYLAVGSDDDFIRVPLGLPAAAMVADRFGFMLPTTRMVDAIYQQAGVRVAPSPMTPGAAMTSTNYFWRHNQTVEGQIGGSNGTLVAGIKKDLVLSERLRRNPGRVAIYGWHRTNGTPIQPLSTVHGAYYADYSHGVRLISRTAFVDGRAVALADILSDPSYAGFLSKEGPIQAPVQLMAALYR